MSKNNYKQNLVPYAIALLLVMAISTVAFVLPVASAHTPSQTFPTFSYVAVSPNPVGVGQSVYVVIWVSPNPPTATGLGGDVWRDMKLTVTTPNGDVKTLGTFNSDATGSTYATFTPDQVGSYKFELNYPGQVISLVGPTGLTANIADLKSRGTDVYVNDTYTGSSATETLTVQQQAIASIPSTPLPTNYWTRPIFGQNSNWATVASNWLGGSMIGGTGSLWQAGAGPNSPHILWTKAIETGGIVGGTSGDSSYAIPDVGFYSGGSYEGRFTNAMIIDGKLFYPDPLGHSLSGGGYTAVDLTTGEVAWHSDSIAVTVGNTGAGPTTILVPSFGQIYDYESQNQHGVVGGILWAVTGTTWSAYDSFTGKFLYNLTNVPAGTTVYDNTGAIVRYVLNYNTATKSGSLALWNNSAHNSGLEMAPAGSNATIAATTNAYQWRPNGGSFDMGQPYAYTWNVTISADLSGLAAPSIVKVIPGDVILGQSTTFNARTGTPDPYTVWAISDKPATRGQLLWIKNYSAPAGGVSRSFPTSSPVDTVNRVFFMQDTETMSLLGYSLDTGALLWGPVSGETQDFGYYGSGRGGGQVGFAAYGNFYTQGFGGEICAFNGKTGELLWKFNNTNSGIETVWGNYPIFIAAIADGKIYAFNNEHSPNYPLYKGEQIYCINSANGNEIYRMLGWAGQTGGAGSETSVLADGVLCYYNYYDNQIYAVGQGLSATTVSVKNDVISQGNSVLIQGTVTDQSAGQTCLGIPAAGTPAISDASMAAWMEYLYMQQPMPNNATGVSVHLTAIDPNGNYQNLGTTTSNALGNFALLWTPPVSGLYTVTAAFEGSNSYYSSKAGTSFAVLPAPSAAPAASASPTQTIAPTSTPAQATTSPSPSIAPQPTSGVPTTTYIVIAAAFVIVAVIAAALVLRRRK